MKSAGKAMLGAFSVGGAYGIIGQLLFVLYSALLGAGSPFVMFSVLITLGALAFMLYVPGIHQKIAKFGGYGSVLPFNGFACGVADAFSSGKTTGKRLAAALLLVLSVMGLGGAVNCAIAAIAQAL